MLRGIWGDDERFKSGVLESVPGKYLCGDNARRDADGYYWIMGRIDDVLNVAGHRLSTIEVESALVSHPAVAEAAAVGRPHEIKGEALAVFVTLTASFFPSESLRKELKDHVRKEIGALAVPDDIRFTNSLPKTRSGKIMRRLLRDIAAGRQTVGDTTTLEDYSVSRGCGPKKSSAATLHRPSTKINSGPSRLNSISRPAGHNGQDENLPVAHAAGPGDLDDRPHDLFDPHVLHPKGDLDLGQIGQRILAAAVLVGIALLAAVPLDLADFAGLQGRVLQGVEHLLDQIRLDDGDNLFHAGQCTNRPGGEGIGVGIERDGGTEDRD